MVLTEWLNTINSYKTNPSLALTILLSTHKHVFFYNVIWLQYVGFIQQIPTRIIDSSSSYDVLSIYLDYKPAPSAFS